MSVNEMDHTAERGESSGREVVIRRIIRGSRHLIFQAWTEARHLARWFGPDGFSVTTRTFDFRPGGVWAFTMHGPDGTDYANHVEWREIVAPERIRYEQGSEAGDPQSFQTTVTFREVEAGTEITLHSVFRTKEQRDRVVEHFGAVEGGHQTLGRLAEYVEEVGLG